MAVKYCKSSETVNGNGRKLSNGRSLQLEMSLVRIRIRNQIFSILWHRIHSLESAPLVKLAPNGSIFFTNTSLEPIYLDWNRVQQWI